MYAGNALAQQAMLMGRVTDANNKPIREAGIFLKGDAGKGVAISDSLGLYATQPLPEGKYKVKVVVNSQVYSATDVAVSTATTKGKYYNFRLGGNKKVEMTVDTKNPFMEQRIGEVRKAKQITPIGSYHMMEVDSAGNIKTNSKVALPSAPTR